MKATRPHTRIFRGSAGLLLLLAAGLHGQPRFEYAADFFSFTQSATFMSWELQSGGQRQRIQQTYLPATLSVPVGPRTTLMLGTAGGFSRAELVASNTCNGMSDVRLRLSQSLGGSRWFLGAGVNLPAGKNKLDDRENAVINALSENVLGFPLQRYGAGFDLELSLAHAWNVSDQLGLGLGATWVRPGAFEFRKASSTRYQPGDRCVITMLLNRLDPVLEWRVRLLGQYFAFDKLDGRRFFRQGWQLEPGVSLEWRFAPQWRGQLSLTHIWKDRNEVRAAVTAGLPPEHYYIDNNSYARLVFLHDFSRRTQAGGYLHFNHFGTSTVQQLNRAGIARLGLQFAAKLSEHLLLGGSADYASGSAENSQGGNLNLSGYGLGLWVKTQF
ncbi:MAG: hypothetical protein ONB48_15060 [candidate division KSB1 bacterium]|nr:hypothetical protein [candidate division KSB1 bacterium]MDZ7273443.1 hypothetical protein [candidate division KSB1 bacterium]MDZ7286965.1 hypothetical protein [candidate division KSB1 bacterium]MDZ7299682.1 hypothetical protein [candidate division KSB1 bacterium]MDZ7307946.1 hypothetical protein [candidate division KSB1 bacterium]